MIRLWNVCYLKNVGWGTLCQRAEKEQNWAEREKDEEKKAKKKKSTANKKIKEASWIWFPSYIKYKAEFLEIESNDDAVDGAEEEEEEDVKNSEIPNNCVAEKEKTKIYKENIGFELKACGLLYHISFQFSSVWKSKRAFGQMPFLWQSFAVTYTHIYTYTRTHKLRKLTTFSIRSENKRKRAKREREKRKNENKTDKLEWIGCSMVKQWEIIVYERIRTTMVVTSTVTMEIRSMCDFFLLSVLPTLSFAMFLPLSLSLCPSIHEKKVKLTSNDCGL